MKKQVRLTAEQKEKIYALYEKNMKERGQPDYEHIATALLREAPPIVITKEAICYQIKQRAKRAKAAVLQAEQTLNEAKQENFKITGEQAQELSDDEVKETDEITLKNSVLMIKYYMAKKAKAEYEKTVGNYIHIDDLTAELKRLYEIINRELNSLKKTMLSDILDKIRKGDNAAAQMQIDTRVSAVLAAIKKEITA